MADPALTTYDKVAYPNLSHIEMHPSSLAAVASLCGHVEAPRKGYRVLEIGCGAGANLLSMALAAPESEFIGVDLAPSAIEIAEATARAAGLTNASFRASNILDADAPSGPFDYIIAHGVYSWAPQVVREGMMSLAARTLTPNGIIAFSYNVFPGCRLRHGLRDMLLRATRGVADPDEKLALAHAFLKRRVEAWGDDPFEAAMKREASRMLKRDPRVLYHDELGEWFEPQVFGDVVALAHANGLDYLCDARVENLALALTPGDLARDVSGEGWVRHEQERDFTSLRRFRRDIFARAGKVGDRRFHPSRLRGLFADTEASAAAPDPATPGTFVFRSRDDNAFETTSRDIASVFTSLAGIFPRALDLGALTAADVSPPLLAALFSGEINLRTRPLACVTSPGERPLACPLARAQAALGETTLSPIKGGSAVLKDDGVRVFLGLLDGTRTLDNISFAMAEKMNAPFGDVRRRAPEVLANLARLGFIVA